MLPKILQKMEEKLYTTNEYGYRYQKPDAKLSDEDSELLAKHYGVKTDVHRTCINCQARQLIKYWDFTQEGYEKNRFAVKCNYIPKELPPGSAALINDLVSNGVERERAIKILKATIDPVSWAELMFGFNDKDDKWRLRSYQKEQLRCTANRYVIREGRRTGKTFSFALKLLYMAFNTKIEAGVDQNGQPVVRGPTIMIVTPYQSQVGGLFQAMEELLWRSPSLKKEIISGTAGNTFVKTPHYKMELANGAIIKGFVSGVGSKQDGSGGGTIRGQSTDILYLDEMDMIPEDILEKAIMPLLLTNAHCVLYATSTPIGKHGKFRKWCTEDLGYKEDYLPSSVLPQWDMLKHQLLSDNTADTFAAEYMAHFIEGGQGVFKSKYVYSARKDYSYEDTTKISWWKDTFGVKETSQITYLIGIDWNKNAGTEFVVIGFDPSTGVWVLVEAINIAASAFSGQEWMAEVMRLNFKWEPAYIYADQGYGHTIIEDLKLASMSARMKEKKTPQDQQNALLLDRLKAFDFKANIELVSPVDYKPIIKSGKEFLVENAIRIFESGKVYYPESEEILRKQLLNYRILRRSQVNNKPVYGPENAQVADHRLDAFMLALGAFTLELGIYSKNNIGYGDPALLTKEQLQVNTLTNAGPSRESVSPLSVLKLMRLGGEDQPVPQRVKTRSRSELQSDTVFDTLFERAAFSPGRENIDYQPAVAQPRFGNRGSRGIHRRGR